MLFGTLTLLWIFPSVGALWILAQNAEWLRTGGLLASLAAVRLEQWIAVGTLLAHAWFIWRWRRAVRMSRPT